MTYGELLHQLEQVRKANPGVLGQPITIHHSIDGGDGAWCSSVSVLLVKGQEPFEITVHDPHCGCSFEELATGHYYMLLEDA